MHIILCISNYIILLTPTSIQTALEIELKFLSVLQILFLFI
jgi:hypothetical protein